MKFYVSTTFLRAENLIAVAQGAERAGFDGMVVSDHLLRPRELDASYGGYLPPAEAQFPDPWVAIAAMASATSTLRFVTGIYIVPLRPPAQVAKAVATAAVLSGNRVALGVGVGWMPEEYHHAEIAFAERYRRLDEALTVIRGFWQDDWFEHHGEFYDFGQTCVRPAPSMPVPVFGSGTGINGQRRAARLDGWIGATYGGPSDLYRLHRDIRQLQRVRDEAGTASDRGYEIIVGLPRAPSVDECLAIAELGVTGLYVQPWESLPRRQVDPGLESVLAAIDEFAEQVIPQVRARGAEPR